MQNVSASAGVSPAPMGSKRDAPYRVLELTYVVSIVVDAEKLPRVRVNVFTHEERCSWISNQQNSKRSWLV